MSSSVSGRACRICANTAGNQVHYPREMMFGWQEPFEYLECGHCGCLQIAAIPPDLAKYYPKAGYYSYKPPRQKTYPAWLLRLRHLRTRHYLGERTWIGAALGAVSKAPGHFEWLRRGRLSLDARIADIGCGAGKLLLTLQRDGFRALLGTDPFIEADIDYGNGVRVLKRGIEELEGRFDFLMLHHSFEHMPDPKRALDALRERISDRGTLLIRIPVCDSYARRKYGIHWMAWDAPRHLYLHTVKSMHLAAAASGFEIFEVSYDSSVQQFASSELYLRGVPYVEQSRFHPGRSPEAFSEAEWRDFERRAEALNRRRDGDTACFYLRPAQSPKGS